MHAYSQMHFVGLMFTAVVLLLYDFRDRSRRVPGVKSSNGIQKPSAALMINQAACKGLCAKATIIDVCASPNTFHMLVTCEL